MKREKLRLMVDLQMFAESLLDGGLPEGADDGCERLLLVCGVAHEFELFTTSGHVVALQHSLEERGVPARQARELAMKLMDVVRVVPLDATAWDESVNLWKNMDLRDAMLFAAASLACAHAVVTPRASSVCASGEHAMTPQELFGELKRQYGLDYEEVRLPRSDEIDG